MLRRFKALLLSDANGPFDRVATLWLESRRGHPLRWQLIDLVYGVGAIAVVWLLLGRTAGLIVAVIWAALMVVGLLRPIAALLQSLRRRG